ncbi:hypothetical protein LLEC1_05264 [Akanthomyces lecanii]|uniref:Uncharacterized protein n=1 Tax=Cordyceps confragosa TaxID=2714763 RepID=A0A179IA99_CORDF|nr:hypothetical protein LLEC1_05264 [Akanthomyces lecanii]
MSASAIFVSWLATDAPPAVSTGDKCGNGQHCPLMQRQHGPYAHQTRHPRGAGPLQPPRSGQRHHRRPSSAAPCPSRTLAARRLSAAARPSRMASSTLAALPSSFKCIARLA